MRKIVRRSKAPAFVAGILSLSSLFLASQAAAQAVKVTIDNVAIEEQKTPDYSVKGVTEKKWTPKSWLEFEVNFEADIARSDSKTINGLTVKYYMFFDALNREQSRTFTGESSLVSVPAGTKTATVVYVSPAKVEQITGADTGGKNKVKMWGVEFLYGGESVGIESSNGKPWWKSANAPPTESGALLKKSETPFAPLWGDYHAAEAK